MKKIIINKNISIAYMLLIALTCLLFVSSVDAATKDESYAGNQLKRLGILKGYTDGSLKLDQPIIRSEVATIMVRIRGYETRSVDGEGRDFTDLTSGHWAYQNIQNAFKLGIIQGYPDYTFKPNDNITYQEVVAIMVNTLGYKDELEGVWPDNYLNKAKEVGIIPANSDVEPTKIISRGEMALIVWDTLLVKLEDTSVLD